MGRNHNLLDFVPTAAATAYGHRPKFPMAKPSAMAKGEKCAYGPTLYNSEIGYL